MTFHIGNMVGISSSQLLRTPSFFRGVPPTSIRLRLNMNRIEFCHIVCWVQSSKAQFLGESQWAFVMDQLETPQEQAYNI